MENINEIKIKNTRRVELIAERYATCCACDQSGLHTVSKVHFRISSSSNCSSGIFQVALQSSNEIELKITLTLISMHWTQNCEWNISKYKEFLVNITLHWSDTLTLDLEKIIWWLNFSPFNDISVLFKFR